MRKAADLFPLRQEIRAGTLKAVRPLPREHLEWKPPGGVHSILDWLRHIAQSEDWWIQAVVMGKHDFVPRGRGHLSDPDAVLQYLEETRAVTEGLLQEWPAAKLQERRPVPSRQRGTYGALELPLHWIFANLFHHELHHRGQIYLYLRLMGLEPPAY